MYKKLRKASAAFFLLFLIAIFASCSRNSVRDDIENFADEYKMLNNTLVLGVANDTEPSENGVVLLDSIDDTLNIQFANLTEHTSEYVLKVFLDYAEVDFFIEDVLRNSYIFQVEAGESVILPIHLEPSNEFNSSHMLTVGIFTAPQKHAKQINLMSNSYGVVLTYEIIPRKSSRGELRSVDYKDASDYLRVDYQGIMLNTDFSPLDDAQVYFPPIDIIASPEEKITLAYRAGNYDNSGGILISVLVNWSQQPLDGVPYLYVKSKSGYISFGEIEIKAPPEPGEYEVVAFVVNQPFEHKNAETFHMHDTAYRFTLTVQ